MNHIFSSQRFVSSAFAIPKGVRDLVVIGGGSGGLSLAKESSRLGASVTLFDYVQPSPHGTVWGLGGTCVNVGCIPKKLMHYSGLLGRQLREECAQYGWPVKPSGNVCWEQIRETTQNYIKRLNFSYRSGLRSAKVNYLNAAASILSANEVEFIHKGERKVLEAHKIAIAVGGRPHIPSELEGSELCITSDDIFSLPHPPRDSLIVGGSYVAMELASFLNDFGYNVTLSLRSIPLRGFDRHCADMVLDHLAMSGVTIIHGKPVKVIKKDNGRLLVHCDNGTVIENLETVVLCVGRRPNLVPLNLGRLPNGGPELTKGTYLRADERDQTTVHGIYAIGDVTGKVELTPVAIKAGELLARRLFAGSDEIMNFDNIPSTVFSSIEYGCVGLAQEKAEEKYGKDKVEVFLQEFDPLEVSCIERPPSRKDTGAKDPSRSTCLAKLICLKEASSRLPILGIHFVGPHAGEVIQGLALAVTLRADKRDLDRLVGVHPTNAEVFTQLDTTLRSGLPFKVAGGCGGGKCG